MHYLRLAWVFVVMMVAVSAAFNFSFGWRLGEHSHTVTQHIHDGWIYGVLSLAGDGFKIVFGVLTVVCITAKKLPLGLRVAGTLFCGMIFALATAYSLNSAIGSISTNRTDMAGIREAKATNYDAVKTQLSRVERELSWLDQGYRASAAINADMAGMRQSSLWTRTAGCTNATVADSRNFCQRYAALQAELGTSLRAEDLDSKATALRTELGGMGGAITADPHAKMLNQLTGYDQPTIVLAWLMLIVALVEGGSTFGPVALAVAHRALQSREVERTAAIQKTVTLEGSRLDPQPVALPRTPMAHLEKVAGVKAEPVSNPYTLPEPVKKIEKTEHVSTEPDGPGTPAPAPKPEPEPKFEDVLTDNVIDATQHFRDTNPKATWKIASKAEKREQRKKTKKERKNPGEVKDFIRECLVLDKGSTEELTGDQIHDAYSDWCDTYGYGILGKGSVSGAVARHFQLPHCREPGARGKHGRKFPGISFKRQQLRKTA